MAAVQNKHLSAMRVRVTKLMSLIKGENTIYVGFFVTLFLVYMVFSDGDFSFILTLSSLISCLSFMVLAYIMETTQSCKGISLQTIICYCLLLFSRLLSILPFQGYLPSDSSGDFFYQFSEVLCFGFAAYIAYLCMYKYKFTYEADIDTMPASYILIPSLIVAIVMHPKLNRNLIGDICWAFALYVETFGVLPQLIMFQAMDRAVTSTVHFTAAQAASKIFGFIFWCSTYRELNSGGTVLTPYVGHWVIFTQFIQVLIVADFFFHYMKCLTRGIPVELIMAEDV